ncbi:MAG: hypothetical protein S4CHLAM81_04680 [Chlamydiales bacterium]|nr:hypothetical protein [Chlamydiales bacterium]MCH9635257.1 hypothetical protein [Chlamydiales bacterium]
MQPLGSDHWASYEVKKRMKETGEVNLEVLHWMIPVWHHNFIESEFKAVDLQQQMSFKDCKSEEI